MLQETKYEDIPAKAAVLAKYPRAWSFKRRNGTFVINTALGLDRIGLGHGDTNEEAWVNAAETIAAKLPV